MNFKKFTAGLLTLALCLSLVSTAKADSETMAVSWIASNDQIDATNVRYTILTNFNGASMSTSGQIVITFDAGINFNGAFATSNILVDWSDNDDNGNPVVTTGTIDRTGQVVTVPFTLTGNFSSGRFATVEIPGMDNPTAVGSKNVTVAWRHGSTVGAGTYHTNTTTTDNQSFENNETTHVVKVLQDLNYTFLGDTTLEYMLEPGTSDTNTHRVGIKTNADSYNFKIYRTDPGDADPDWQVSGGAVGASFPLDSGTSAWGETNSLGSTGTASLLGIDEKGFGVAINRDAANEAQTDTANSPADTAGSSTIYDIPDTTGAEAIAFDRVDGNMTGRNTEDGVFLDYTASVDWTVETGTYQIRTTYLVTPDYVN